MKKEVIVIDKKLFLGIVIALFMITLGSGIFAPPVSHSADEIVQGTFLEGDYNFNGSLEFSASNLKKSQSFASGSNMSALAGGGAIQWSLISATTIPISGSRLITNLAWGGQTKYATNGGYYALFADSSCNKKIIGDAATSTVDYSGQKLTVSDPALLHLGSEGDITLYGCGTTTAGSGTQYVDNQYITVTYEPLADNMVYVNGSRAASSGGGSGQSWSLVSNVTIPVTGSRLVQALAWSGGTRYTSAGGYVALFADNTCSAKLSEDVGTSTANSYTRKLTVSDSALLQLGTSGDIIVYACARTSSGSGSQYVANQHLSVVYTTDIVDVIPAIYG